MNTKYALIIPTRNRPVFLERALRYYETAQAPFPIIVGDSSDDIYLDENIKLIESLKSSRIDLQHIKYPSETEFIDKMVELIDHVDAEFIKFAADDDFVSIDFMKNAAVILEHDLNCSAVYGKEIRFKVKNDECFGQIQNLSYIARDSVIAASTSARVLKQSRQLLFTPVYNMKRRTLWLKIAQHFKEVSKTNKKAEQQAMFLDIIENLSTVAAGNLRGISDSMLIRQMHASAETNTLRSRQDELARMVTPEWQQLIEIYLKIMIEHFKSYEDLTHEEAQQLAEFGYWSYVSRQLKGWVGRRGLKLSDQHSFENFRLSSKPDEYWRALTGLLYSKFIEPIKFRSNAKEFSPIRAIIEQGQNK